MSRVILQPTGNKDAREHYVDTLIRPVDILRIKPFVTEDQFERIKKLYPNGLVPTWGVTPGVNNVNAKKWNRIEPADVTFFSAKRVLYSYGFVTYKIHNVPLAEHLWGRDSKGQTWEYIYFLDEIREHDIPVSLFNEIVGYSPNFNVQGFSVLDEQKSNVLLSYFDLESETAFQPVTERDYKEVIEAFNKDTLDIEGKTKSRAEQGFIRKALFGNRTIHTCQICGKEYPIQFLVAAHIKKRSLCTKEEKLDYQNIVMPMCKFGCDDLFEKGYILVKDGKVALNQKLTTEWLDVYLHNLAGREIDNWNERNAKYFVWHAKHHSLSKVR